MQKLSIRDLNIDINTYSTGFLKFKNLVSLDIHVGHIHPPKLPQQIGQLNKLKRLSILNVNFLHFPTWIQHLGNLEFLMVRGCDMDSIPSFIGDLRKLQTLRVENCDLTTIPKELNQLKKLQELSLSDTKITYFPLDHLPPNLKTLGLEGPIFRYDEKELCRLRNFLPKVKIHSILSVDCSKQRLN